MTRLFLLVGEDAERGVGDGAGGAVVVVERGEEEA